MSWEQVAIGVFVGLLAYHSLHRLWINAFGIFARRNQTILRWIEESERKDRPLRDALQRGQAMH